MLQKCFFKKWTSFFSSYNKLKKPDYCRKPLTVTLQMAPHKHAAVNKLKRFLLDMYEGCPENQCKPTGLVSVLVGWKMFEF